MADIHWTNYVGMATGIAGAILGLVSYIKSNEIVKSQMRLDVKRNHSDLGASIQTLKEIISKAIGSRKSIDAAEGRIRSGGHELWIEEAKLDETKILNIEAWFQMMGINIEKCGMNELEKLLHNIHNQNRSVSEIKEKYECCLSEDRERSKRLQDLADQRVRKNT